MCTTCTAYGTGSFSGPAPGIITPAETRPRLPASQPTRTVKPALPVSGPLAPKPVNTAPGPSHHYRQQQASKHSTHPPPNPMATTTSGAPAGTAMAGNQGGNQGGNQVSAATYIAMGLSLLGTVLLIMALIALITYLQKKTKAL